LAQLLVESVLDKSGPLPAGIENVSLEEALRAGFDHRVRPALLRRLRATEGALPGWLGVLEATRHKQLLAQLQSGHDLRLIATAFEEHGVRWAVAKGPVLAQFVWPHPDMREFGDLDLFVHPEDFAAGLNLLEEVGASYVDRNWPEIRRQARAELALRGPSGFPIDLHWHVLASPRARRFFRADLPELLGRARHIELGGGLTVPTFDASDTVVHLAHHAAQSAANRLVWLADVLYASHHPDVDWNAVSDRALTGRMGITVGVVLSRVERTLGVEFPLPADLRRCAERSLCGRIAVNRDGRHPFPHLPSDSSSSGIEYKAARANDPLSVLAAAGLWLGVRRTEWRIKRHGPDSNPLDVDVPDPAARAAYLGQVR
jgi:hypothetical protein